MSTSPSSKWMSALHDDSLSLNTNASCVALTDFSNDGDVKIIVADLGTSRVQLRLKVFKGVQKTNETVITEMPIAIIPFVNEQVNVATIGVACGHSVYVYKALKPYYRFDLPDSPLMHVEQLAWDRFYREGGNTDVLIEMLTKAAEEVSLSDMSPVAQRLLVASSSERDALIDKVANLQNKIPRNKSPITCVATMKKSQPDVSPVDVLVLGCENGAVHFIDTQAFQSLSSVSLPSPPVYIIAHGIWDVEFKIFVSTRAGTVYSIKRDQMAAKVEKPLATMSRRIIAMTKFGKIIAIATDDNRVTFYNFKGKRLKEFTLPSRIFGLEPFTYEPKQYTALLVALQNEIFMYTENALVDTIRMEVDIKWIRFGPLGREDAALIIGTKVGGLVIKLFRRIAVLTEIADIKGPSLAHRYKLEIPKRTKVFIDQTQRERDNPVTMHKMYQRDLFLLRYLVTQQFALLTTKALSSVSTSSSESVSISVDVNGFGPTFRLTVKLSSGTPTPLSNMWLSFVYPLDFFKIEDPLIPVAVLTPGNTYTFTTLVEALNPEKGMTADVKVYLFRSDRPTPIVTAIITMPLSEMSLLD